jgi:CRP/FNR family transcriptional regulator
MPEAPANRRRLKAGEALFRSGEPFTALYAVRAGFLKTAAVLPDGERRILAYHIMGDVIGLDAIGRGTHPTETVSLNTCEVCEIPMDRAERMMAGRQAVSAHLRGLLSEQLAKAGDHMVALASYSARQRVAGFLLDLAARWAVRGYSPNEFDLCLTRKEIGSYLGLTFETVSRTLSYFHSQGFIFVAGREIRILDRAALQAQFHSAEAAAA